MNKTRFCVWPRCSTPHRADVRLDELGKAIANVKDLDLQQVRGALEKYTLEELMYLVNHPKIEAEIKRLRL